MTVHPTAEAGFEAAAAEYERSRPDYPTAAVDLLAERLQLASGRRVVDLAAGTGKLTRPLVATGADVIAMEPVAGMRRELARVLPSVDVRDGRAEEIPLPDASVDVVTVGQAFHWFDAPRALAEIRRVLASEGCLAVIFNTRDLETPEQRGLDELLRPWRGNTPSWSDHGWRDALLAPEGFEPPEYHTWPHRQVVGAAGMVGRVASISFVAELDEPQRAELLAATRELFDTLAHQGTVSLAYTTELTLLRTATQAP